MNHFKFISFYTKDTPYEQVFQNILEPSLKRFYYPWDVKIVDSKGSWIKNVALKPEIILNELKSPVFESIVFLDADAQIVKCPDYFERIPAHIDFAAHWLDWNTWYRNGSDTKEMISSVMYFRKSDKTRRLVSEWAKLCVEFPAIWEQKLLQSLVESAKWKISEGLNVLDLPIEMCYINSMPNGNEPFVKCDPVIVQHQASRKYKKQIK